jgi:hypothetical protein
VGPPELIAMMLRVGSDSGTVATTHINQSEIFIPISLFEALFYG